MRHNLSLTIVAMVNNTAHVTNEDHKPHHTVCADTIRSQVFQPPGMQLVTNYETIKSYASSFSYLEPNTDDLQYIVIRPVAKNSGWKGYLDANIVSVPGNRTIDGIQRDGSYSPFDALSFLGVSNTLRFDWSESDQGLLLGSFFWGYLITQIPGGCLSQKYGGKTVFAAGMIISSFFTFITPWAVALGGKLLLIAARFFQGLGQVCNAWFCDIRFVFG